MSPGSKDDSSASDFINFTLISFVEGNGVCVCIYAFMFSFIIYCLSKVNINPKQLAPRALLSSGICADLYRRNRGITRSLPAELLGGDGSVSPIEGCRQTLERCVKWHALAVMKKSFTNCKGTKPLRSY